MDGGILNQTAHATGKLPAFEWPARERATFFSNGFGAVALFSVIGLTIALYLATATSPCTGIDLNAGCVPLELTGMVAP